MIWVETLTEKTSQEMTFVRQHCNALFMLDKIALQSQASRASDGSSCGHSLKLFSVIFHGRERASNQRWSGIETQIRIS